MFLLKKINFSNKGSADAILSVINPNHVLQKCLLFILYYYYYYFFFFFLKKKE